MAVQVKRGCPKCDGSMVIVNDRWVCMKAQHVLPVEAEQDLDDSGWLDLLEDARAGVEQAEEDLANAQFRLDEITRQMRKRGAKS